MNEKDLLFLCQEPCVISEPEEAPPPYEDVVGWASKSQYKCAFCGDDYPQSGSVLDFLSHLTGTHKMSGAEYAEKFGSLAVESWKMECAICDVTLIHDWLRLLKHLHLRYFPLILLLTYHF